MWQNREERRNVSCWPDPEMVDRQVRPGLTDRYLVDTGRSSAIFRCFLKEQTAQEF